MPAGTCVCNSRAHACGLVPSLRLASSRCARASRSSLANVRDVKWLGRGEWKPREKALAMKTLTEIGRYPGLLKDIRAAIGADDEVDEEVEVIKKPVAPA